MPELPEVETTRRGIAPHLEGQRVTRVVVRERRLRWPIPEDLDVRLSGQRVDGEMFEFVAEGWFARIMQHEYDHLNGTLYVNRLEGKWQRRWKRAQRAERLNVPGVTWLPGTDEDPFGHDADDHADHEHGPDGDHGDDEA